MLDDLRVSFRSFFRSPGAVVLAILVLALGIAGSTIVFSFVHALLLDPLEIREETGIYRLFGTERRLGTGRQRLSAHEIAALEDETTVFDGPLLVARNTGKAVTDAERPLNPLMREVGEAWLETMGAQPVLGRLFRPEEIGSARRLTVISWSLWQNHFGGDPNVVGRAVELEYEPWEVIGVIGAEYSNPLFGNLGTPALWLPLPDLRSEPEDPRLRHVVLGRSSIPAVEIESQLNRVALDLERESPETRSDRGFRAIPLRASLVEQIRPSLFVLSAAVVLVLLIACANVAHLLLARILGRSNELVVRRALGARTFHLIRLVLSESLLLASMAGAVAILATGWALQPLLGLRPDNTPVPLLERVQLQPEVVGFGVLLAFVTALLASLPPILRILEPGTSVPDGARTIGSRSSGKLRRVLVISEIALSVTLVAGAGLAIRSLAHLRNMPLGFQPESTVVFRTGARGPGLETPAQWATFHRNIRERLSQIPGVESVGATQFLPMFARGGLSRPILLNGPGSEEFQGVLLRTTPGYFRAFGQDLLEGRGFVDSDDANGERVAIVTRTVLSQLGLENPVGSTLRLGEGEVARIVGVAGDVRGLVEDPSPPPIIYVPQAQDPTANLSFFLRGQLPDEAELLKSIEDAVWSVSRDVPVYGFTALPNLVHDLEWRPRFVGQLLSGFAFLALALAATGLYAVLSASVLERRAEIGLRMALGADRTRLLGLIEGEALRLALIGSALGLGGALLLGRGLAAELHGIESWDPPTLAATIGVLVLTALLAAGIPAWRATRIAPSTVLRES